MSDHDTPLGETPHGETHPELADEPATDSVAKSVTESATGIVAMPTDDSTPAIDLDAMTADLDGVEIALARLADGSYWTDEVTGEPIAAATLEAHPMARRS